MRYAYYDLGDRGAGTKVVVRWKGSGAKVMLLDPVNFCKYRYTDGRPFFYEAGGQYGRPPARLSIPEDGRWFVVADLGSDGSRARPTVEVLAADASAPEVRQASKAPASETRRRGKARSPAGSDLARPRRGETVALRSRSRSGQAPWR